VLGLLPATLPSLTGILRLLLGLPGILRLLLGLPGILGLLGLLLSPLTCLLGLPTCLSWLHRDQPFPLFSADAS
jgi:hypothetical protein